MTTSRSHLEPDRMAELSALNPGHDQKKLTRLAILADIHDEDDAATGALEPGEDCPDCHNTGVVWFDVDTPGTPHYCGGCSGYPGITHEPACGTEPCPRGCEPKEAIR